MRARTINEEKIHESIDFERGETSKISLGIGGVFLEPYYIDIFETPRNKILETWLNFIKKTFEGKTVKGNFGSFYSGMGGRYWSESEDTVQVLEIISEESDVKDCIPFYGRSSEPGSRKKKFYFKSSERYYIK
jgi:hypothetical protein